MKAMAMVVAMGVAAAMAAGAEAGVDAREAHQRARIADNVRTGALNPREAARLTAEQARIRREEYRYRHDDGVLGPWERADLRRDLDRASARIYREAHDRQ